VKETEDEARASHLYSYKHTFNGFAALLTPNEANHLSGNVKVDNFISPTVSNNTISWYNRPLEIS